MNERRASQTALFMAAYRARASTEADPLCADPWAERLAGEEGAALARRYDTINPHMTLWTAVRTAFIDERVRRALSAPWSMAQVVLLGAGLDTRSARLAAPGVRFFEVDHPDSQADKLARLHRLADYPSEAATHVPCDFESEDFVVQLVKGGFDVGRPALFVWEGVTPYLSEGAVRATLHRIAVGAEPRSVVVFDHLRRKIVAGEVADPNDARSRDFVGELGEPLRWGCDDVLPVLYQEGYRRVRTSSFDEVCLALTGSYVRERKFRFQSLAVASVARAELP